MINRYLLALQLEIDCRYNLHISDVVLGLLWGEDGDYLKPQGHKNSSLMLLSTATYR